MFNCSSQNSNLPPTLTQACISLILKEDKDPDKCSSYRPTSLPSVDVKVQTGDCHAQHHVRGPNWIYQEPPFFSKCTLSPKCYALLTILSGPWSSYITGCGEGFWSSGMGLPLHLPQKCAFIPWVRLLYSSQQACVSFSNSIRSSFFKDVRSPPYFLQ